ncbi:C4-dicarboxylate transport protein [compost metagenome]
MSEARAITNTIGNAVGTVAIANWVGALDKQRMAQALDGQLPAEPQPTETRPALAQLEAGTPTP